MDCSGCGRSLPVHLLNLGLCRLILSRWILTMWLSSKGLKAIFVILGTLLLWTGQASAAEKNYQDLSLDDCLALARQYNPVMAASREKIQELTADYQAARSEFFPRLVLSSFLDRQPPNRFPPGG